MSTFIIAEAGINHNGDINIAKKLIQGAKFAGADAIKFQKRTIDLVYTKEELDKYRESPWGNTNRAQKEGLEFGKEQYDEIDRFCKEIGIEWFASCWDMKSVEFMKQYNTKYNKIASARLGHRQLLEATAKERKHTFISTGMATHNEIYAAVDIFRSWSCPYELMHCNSEYPFSHDKANLKVMEVLRKEFNCPVGYSCHTPDLITPVTAAILGATSIEKHITLNRAMYGSDQAASVEIMGFYRLIDYIRSAEQTLGNGNKTISDVEKKIREKLYRTEDIV